MKLYWAYGSNSMKVALLLEELGIKYEPVLIEIYKGEQKADSYLAINPNGKVPSIVSDDVTMFDSNAILLYLAQKHKKFVPEAGQAYADLLSWLMFIATGLGPFSGQASHFRYHAPKDIPYARNRYQKEAFRHYALLEKKLENQPYIMGEDYTIVDMDAWGWIHFLPLILEDGFTPFPNLKKWVNRIESRPAAQRALKLLDTPNKNQLDDEAITSLFTYYEKD